MLILVAMWRNVVEVSEIWCNFFKIDFFYVIFFAETSLGYLGTSPGPIEIVSWPESGCGFPSLEPSLELSPQQKRVLKLVHENKNHKIWKKWSSRSHSTDFFL